jgi:hypothetical protein
MLNYDKGRIASGGLKVLRADTSVSRVVSFIEKQLAAFSNKELISSIANEKGLTQELCIFLTNHAKKENFPFMFEKEYMEESEKGGSPQVDIGVIMIDSKCYGNRKSFFSIEAKRLSKISKAREKEYLVGRMEKGKYKQCGGVERFKKEIHGKGLKYGGMIGYLQEYDFDYWRYTINSWIDALIEGEIPTSAQWSENDKLTEEYKYSTTAKFVSENSRKTGSIILIHLWVNLINSKSEKIQ